jgi:hypothetical protein
MVYEIKKDFLDAEAQKEINQKVYDPEIPLDNDCDDIDPNKVVPTSTIFKIGPTRFFPEALKKYLNGEEIEISTEMLIDLFIFEGSSASRESLIEALYPAEDGSIDLEMEQTYLYENEDDNVEIEVHIPNPDDFLPREKTLYNLMVKNIGKHFPSYKDAIPYKTVVRCLQNWDFESFHSDQKEGTTFLYFTNLDYDIERRGEVQFLTGENEIESVLPIPNTIIRCDSNATYRHNPFIHISDQTDIDKFVVEIKYDIPFE